MSHTPPILTYSIVVCILFIFHSLHSKISLLHKSLKRIFTCHPRHSKISLLHTSLKRILDARGGVTPTSPRLYIAWRRLYIAKIIGTMSEDYNSNNDSLFFLKEAFDCDALCVVTQEVDGKRIHGRHWCKYGNDARQRREVSEQLGRLGAISCC